MLRIFLLAFRACPTYWVHLSGAPVARREFWIRLNSMAWKSGSFLTRAPWIPTCSLRYGSAHRDVPGKVPSPRDPFRPPGGVPQAFLFCVEKCYCGTLCSRPISASIAPEAVLGGLWGLWGPFWGSLGPQGRCFGGVLGPPGSLWGVLGPLEGLWGLLGVSGTPSVSGFRGHCWRAPWAPITGFVKPCEAPRGPFASSSLHLLLFLPLPFPELRFPPGLLQNHSGEVDR